MFQGVSNRCSAHSTDGQMEARKDEATLLQLQSQGWHLGLLMAHLIQVTKPRWHSGDVQCWVIVSIRGHPNFCPVFTKMWCCCPLPGLPRAGFTVRSSAGDRLPFPPDPARMGHEPTLPRLLRGTRTPRGRTRLALQLALPPLEPHPARCCRLRTFRTSPAQPAAFGMVITRCLTRAG